MAQKVCKIYGYELRIGDRIATKYHEPTGRVIRSFKVVTIEPPIRIGTGKHSHNHTNHLHVNMGFDDPITGCWDMYALIPVVRFDPQ